MKGNAMATGTIKMFNQDKGFGFIKPDGAAGGNDVFVHISSFEQAGMPVPKEGDRVSYDLGTDRRTGKSRAENLRRA